MIGKSIRLWAIVSVLFFSVAHADTGKFAAEVDRTQIGRDDSVSLKLTVQAEGSVEISPPQYSAPDFEEINSYESSYVESYYDSNTGRIGMRNNQSLTKVLRPTKTGHLTISGITVSINGQVHHAPNIVVQVGSSGSGTPPPRNYGGSGVGLRGATKRAPSNTVFVRAEVDKDKAYKGEELVVSYYLYRRVRVLNLQVDKFPMLNGFLREEMEMPVMSPRLDVESVVLDGVPYQRSLLARYAAFPLQEGQLKIDPMGIKYTYYAGSTDDGEDPFLQFFKSMSPREGAISSDPVNVTVQSLPTDGKPASFSGAVGDFSMTSAADKTEVHANEALTLTVKIEGRGNVAAIGQPKAKWPDNIELYDSKGSAKATKAGVGEKDFEILLIPRVPGDVTLPGLELSYFDPAKKQYLTRTTEPIHVHVLEAVAGSTPPRPIGSAPVTSASSAASSASPVASGMLGLKAPQLSSGGSSFGGLPLWRYIYILAASALALFAAWAGFDIIRNLRTKNAASAGLRAKARAKDWGQIALDAGKGASAPLADVLKIYDRVTDNVFSAIDQSYSMGARSLPRAEIGRILIQEHGIDAARWAPIDRFLEFNELIRFSGAASSAMENRARSELSTWVGSVQAALKSIEKT